MPAGTSTLPPPGSAMLVISITRWLGCQVTCFSRRLRGVWCGVRSAGGWEKAGLERWQPWDSNVPAACDRKQESQARAVRCQRGRKCTDPAQNITPPARPDLSLTADCVAARSQQGSQQQDEDGTGHVELLDSWPACG